VLQVVSEKKIFVGFQVPDIDSGAFRTPYSTASAQGKQTSRNIKDDEKHEHVIFRYTQKKAENYAGSSGLSTKKMEEKKPVIYGHEGLEGA
jgi:hypothetical protein